MSKEKFAEFLSRLLPKPVQRELPEKIKDLIARGAIFVINHSGGKDSQAMTSFLRRHVPEDQLVVVHALLPEVEWEGVEDHVRKTTQGLPVHTCRSRRTLLEMIEERGMFPSPSQRQCTSDLKRGPIEKVVRGLVETRIRKWLGLENVARATGTQERVNALAAGMGLVVNCMGMRAEESPKRSKLQALKYSERNSKAGRDWYEWLPIHDWTVEEVFSEILAAGQKVHWAYYEGMSRLSCCFCIMSSKEDLTTAARLNSKLYARYVGLEQSTGQVMMMPTKKHGRLSLEDITGIKVIPIKLIPSEGVAA